MTPWNVPVFSYQEGLISGRLVRAFLENGLEILGREKTELEAAALDYVDEVANRPDVTTRVFNPARRGLLSEQLCGSAWTY